MDPYQKYFVSQHFGKSLATVAPGVDSGCVTITLTHPEQHNVKFYFQNARIGRFVEDPDQRADAAMRIAIQQAHKLFLSKGIDALTDSEHQLAVEINPWIGDLSEVQYGGATAGYACALARAFAGAAAHPDGARLA
jgi:hypothetical protein